MEFSTLGSSFDRISRLGFGCAPMSGYDYGRVDDAEITKAVREAVERGVNIFDTAAVYGFGHAEELLGKALGNERNKVFIATKFGLRWDQSHKIIRDCSAENVLKSVDESLQRLGVDTITLFQIHWPDPSTPLQETMEALLECQAAGKIRYIGCSNFDINLIKELQTWGRIDAIQTSYNLMDRSAENEILPSCNKRKLAFIAHSPLARGFLTGKYKIGHVFEGADTRNKCSLFSEENRNEKEQLLETMKRIAIQYDKTISQVAIRWLLDNPLVSCAIVGIKNVIQLEENIASTDWNLLQEDIASLSSHSQEALKTTCRK